MRSKTRRTPTKNVRRTPTQNVRRTPTKNVRRKVKRVVKVQSDDDAKKVNNAEKVFLRFKMEGCPWCVDSEPAWKQMCSKVEDHLSPNSLIAEMKDDVMPQMQSMMNLDFFPTSFPSHVIFINGKRQTEEADRSLEGLIQTLQKYDMLNQEKNLAQLLTPQRGGSKKRRSRR